MTLWYPKSRNSTSKIGNATIQPPESGLPSMHANAFYGGGGRPGHAPFFPTNNYPARMEVHKAHRPSKRKNADVERHNPKAFTFSGGYVSVQRRVKRSAEVTQKRLKVDQAVDKASSVNPPPFIVVVQGPQGCGKTSLIKALVKHYTKQNIVDLKGAAVTCVASKNRRLTLIECPSNDLSAMIDLAKVADLAITMIDTRKGLELDTLEFINLMKNHGMPRVMGVLTFLDTFGGGRTCKRDEEKVLAVNSKKVRSLKKKLKQRFWTELYEGAKLFFLSGLKANKYLPRDVLNLARFISTQRFDPIVWRSEHPHLLMLGLEVDAPKEEELENNTRTVAFTGYVKGSPARDTHVYHIPGCGDFSIDTIYTPVDPCPLPLNRHTDINKQTDAVKHIYAPMCEIGALAIEGESIFVTLPDDDRKQAAPAEIEEDAMTDAKSLIECSVEVDVSDDDVHIDEEAGPESEAASDTSSIVNGGLPPEWQCDFDGVKKVWEENEVHSDDETQDVAEQLKTAAKDLEEVNLLNRPTANDADDWNAMIYSGTHDATEEWRLMMCNGQTTHEALILGEEEDANPTEITDLWDGFQPSPEFVYGGLEDYINRKKVAQEHASKDSDSEESTDDSNDDDSTVDNTEFAAGYGDLTFDTGLLKAIRLLFFATGAWDNGPDEEKLLLGKKGDVQTMGIEVSSSSWSIPVGQFVRIKIHGVSNDWLEDNFGTSARPVIIGGTKPEENRATFIHARARRHRWHYGVLKSTEPLLISCGWRRYQSLPYYAMEDRDGVRNRYLKYTPEHMHCQAYFHGFGAPPGTGVVGIKHMDRALKREDCSIDDVIRGLNDGCRKSDTFTGWRLSFVGTVVENIGGQPKVMKKIKFIGSVVPEHVSSSGKNTVYVKDMFTSAAEVARCVGVPIQTQSGNRGLIKKPYQDSGVFRATFEAPVKPNDIIICKAWYRVPMEPFCNPQMDVANWDYLRTFGEVRQELGLRVDGSRVDSVYKSREVHAPAQDRGPRIPARLRNALPVECMKEGVAYKTRNEDNEKITIVTNDSSEKPEPHFTPYEKMVNSLLAKVEEQKTARLAHQQAQLKARIAEHERVSNLKRKAYAEKEKELMNKRAAKRGNREKLHRKKMRLE